jgi:hypothetical protein
MQKVGLLSFLALALTSLHGIHSIELKDGSGIRGAIVLERPEVYYVDLGFNVVAVPKDAVVSLGEVDSVIGKVAMALVGRGSGTGANTDWPRIRVCNPWGWLCGDE